MNWFQRWKRRQSSQVPVVDVDVGDEFCGGGSVRKGEVPYGDVAVHRVKREAALLAEAYGIFQKISLAGGPEYNLMPLGCKPAERIYGKGFFCLPPSLRLPLP